MNYNELNFQGIEAERQWDVSEAFPVLMSTWRGLFNWFN